ncbi:TetR family transcriptional regulator [Gemmobacter nanjingensis]|uniref:TetR family transcriptional regulator n=1 Tax=Gemmobacter nanjingensis TaxID=488454 RepID=A0ABQ3FU29_9RHOB|nr:TetR/AcrR family transcriptional regulator [Gemmobacter nanjingensis]GHC41016.1 TetR family transcriptional regulator [Gemmobacter nanjingensis]
MAEPNRLADKMADAARAAWVAAARDSLIASGVSGLNLRGLSASLGVTTGAFYSVFSGLEDLHEALRQRWIDQNVTPMIEAIAAVGDDGFMQYLAALRVTILEDGIDPRFDNAIRDWAHSSPRTAEVLADADTLRIAALERMFLALGEDEKRAMIRARIAYFHQVGYGTLEIHDDPDERLLNLRYYAEALTGRRDLLVCTSADEVRQFILTGHPPVKVTA